MAKILRAYSFYCLESICKQPEHSGGYKGLPEEYIIVMTHDGSACATDYTDFNVKKKGSNMLFCEDMMKDY